MTSKEPIDAMSQALMSLRVMMEPMHEFLIGEVAYFESQGFTSEQARQMACAEYSKVVLNGGMAS
jgi:hypothetical protein